jgi:putative zinc finger/helix-turn-helix YgiT family protein
MSHGIARILKRVRALAAEQRDMTKKASNQRASVARRRGQALPNDACPRCGAVMAEKRGKLRLPVNGEEISVAAAVHLSCPRCREVVLRFQDERRLSADAIAMYRRKHGLLSAAEIRGIRERFNLTQADFARLLRLGANTLSRWESGRNAQTEAMDTLLRMIRDVPGSIEYLRHHAA